MGTEDGFSVGAVEALDSLLEDAKSLSENGMSLPGVAAFLGGRYIEVYYDGAAWPTRPTTTASQRVYWYSPEHINAVQPSMVDGDIWLPHPQSAVYGA